jgi:hypothetical protein
MIRATFFTLLMCLCMAAAADAQIDFNRFFVDATMRIDYYHTGSKEKEYFAIDQVLKESSWAGSTVNLVDTLNLGEYLGRINDFATGQLIYSRGYSSFFNEWQTTDEAGTGVLKTISESFRVPMPKRKVQFTILRRDRYQIMRELFTVLIDPATPGMVSAEKRSDDPEVVTLIDNGDPHKKVDILILGDGYTRGDMEKFKKDAKHFNDVMFDNEPFKSRKNDFNVRAVCAVSDESGIDIPGKNVWKNTALGTRYDTFGSARYVLTEENKALRDVASAVPYDFVTILLNDSRYGGGGIFQLYTTTYTIEKNEDQAWQRDYVYVHEFGHSFGGLGDEYYSSSTGYNDFYPAGVEPWEPNITRLLDPSALKWKSSLAKNAAIPTPWDKAAYDSLGNVLASLDRLAADYYKKKEPTFKKQKDILKDARFAQTVGAFEGAGYVSKGMYRPALDCKMFSLTLGPFDPVCSAAIERQIDFYSK